MQIRIFLLNQIILIIPYLNYVLFKNRVNFNFNNFKEKKRKNTFLF